VAGLCYIKQLKPCAAGFCAAGSACVNVWVNMCHGTPCTACGSQGSYCLPSAP